MLPPLATEPREALYGLSGVYLDAYNAIVQPQRKLSVSVYTLRRWAAQLGGTGFWLLVTLQQQMYRNGRGQCVVSRDVLAREAAVSEGTVHYYLHGEQYRTSGLCHFVRQRKNNSRMWSKAIGKMVQPTAQYAVLVDAPLAQIDQRGLAQYLVERGGAGASAQDVAPLLENLIATRSLTDVLALLDEHAKRFEPPAGWQKDTFLPTVVNVVNALGVKVGNNGSGTPFMDLCSRVQRHIIAWDWVGQHYFFEKWLPVLKPTLALAIVKMRSMCFWNERELRDEVKIRVSDLAAMVGCKSDRMRQLLSLPEAGEFLEEISVGTKHCPGTFKVKLIEPIAQADMALYQSLLNGAEVTSTGQLGFELVHAIGVSGAISDVSEVSGRISDTSEVSGRISDTSEVSGRISDTSEGISGRISDTSEVSDRISDTSEGVSGRISDGILTLYLNTTPRITLEQQKQQHAEGNATAVASGLLDVFGIEQPSKGRIVSAGAKVDVLRALMLNVVVVGHRKGWDRGRIQGTFIQRALSNDRDDCPSRFVRWAKLTPDEWRALWRASRGDGAGMTSALDAVIAEWVEDFGEMFPNGPFGDDDPAAVANALQRLTDEQDKYAREHAPVPTPPMSVEEAMAHGYAMINGDGDTISVDQAWANALSEMQLQLTGATYDTWLSRSRAITFQDDVFTIGVHNGYAKDWLENRLLPMVKRALCSVAHLESIEIRFVVMNQEMPTTNVPLDNLPARIADTPGEGVSRVQR